MSDDIVISVENISKAYQLGVIGTGTFYGDVQRWWAKQRGLPDPTAKLEQKNHGNRDGETVWALRDISFEVRRGEAVGIIGHNGAGKSTLLKILSRVTSPTSGEIKVKGRIASLLEVGTGFHPELTGRQNIYLNGAILGMNRREITQKLDEIVDFSGVEKYIDTPVKRYSSGMYVRLAFAVAAHLDPEILIVDEVLAVGDAEFQKKCLGKMGDVAQSGRTVLFVSHNMTAVKNLCQEGLLLQTGAVVASGEVNGVINTYLSAVRKEVREQTWESPASAPGNDLVWVKQVRMTPMGELQGGFLTVKSAFRVHFQLGVLQPALLNIVMVVKSSGSNEVIFTSPSPRVECEPGIIEFACDIPADLMNDGVYSITLKVVKSAKTILEVTDCVMFEIHEVMRDGNWWGKRAGAVRPALDWQYTTEFGAISEVENAA